VTIGCDLNPDFPSSLWARRQTGVTVVPVQHHHAHIVAAALEHGVVPPVLGLAIDGTGLGTDGTVWGCELLLAERGDFRRLGHLLPSPLPGGDAAVHEPWRAALGLLHESFGSGALDLTDRLFHGVAAAAARGVHEAMARGVNTPRHSSCGRLFDGVAALANVCTEARFEAEAAMLLERAAGPGRYERDRAAPFPIEVVAGDVMLLDHREMVREMVRRRLAGDAPETLARRFHDTLVQGMVRLVTQAAAGVGHDTVVLTGGCMLNRRLAEGLLDELERAGLRALVPRQLPVGDGGVSLGQAAVAAWRSNLVPGGFPP
ncbi:MAG: hypothetical protein MUE60_02915, partial [Candidatus Eisenbacteria bacterium]|jgi:hydrogenase maturation protein HypF|nr:hypothetical protein [Candidatus Eisenbacteria bacterium]